jgi:hypothetical protein
MEERVYGALLRLYPSSFRGEYREPMRQVFRDQLRDAGSPSKRRRLWAGTIVDLLRSVVALHLEERMRGGTSIAPVAACVFGLAAAMFLGRFELHTDDSGVEVFFILLFTFILGCWYPKRAWLVPLLGLSAPLAELFWGRSRPSLNHTTGLALLAGFVVLVGLIGSYSGVLIRKFVIANASK